MNSLVIYPAFLDFQEVVIIMVVAVVIFGPDKIPEIARGLGAAVRKLKEASEDIKQEIMNPVQEVDPTKDIQNTINELNPLNEVKETFQKINPMEDFQKSFEELSNPVDELHNAIHQENTVETALRDTDAPTMKPVDPVQDIETPTSTEPIAEEPVEPVVEEPTIIKEPKTVDEALGLGGSVSR
ncbi:twin-arginine translocase TatA/TatE family subunit [uncultured Empedobacter sp.]|uniref:twin-arginine translocase TatA/TatE family subunit n=1 Tax=uncultured Empedobacter sp. TaxID=410844 RepID=UPI00260F93E9|nr:twin-arginine translocase TatA/TatE family subunit [uncultured Empedobacter sp.]